MTGVLGWLGAPDSAASTLQAMATAGPRLEASSLASLGDANFGVGADGLPRTAGVFGGHGLIAAFYGHPFWMAADRRTTEISEVAARFLDAFTLRGVDSLAALHGDYALALIDPQRSRVVLAVDRMSIRNIVYTAQSEWIVFGPTCDSISRHPAIRRELDPQQLYSYMYFHMVPGPSTIFRCQQRVPPGHFVDFRPGSCVVRPHWQPTFVENSDDNFATLKRKFRGTLSEAVRALSSGERCGTFLSGGTDSSTISGMLGPFSDGPAQTFSIGFAQEGYDEMHYARIAASHFGTAQHEYYVTPENVVDAIPSIAQSYDQPFGNASAVPTYYCARLARSHGVQRILGGDGGDELFGGNSRYARQQQLARYDRIPAVLRRGVVGPLVRNLPLQDRITLFRKARSYVDQASLPMPNRYDTYNLLERLGPENIFMSEFLDGVDQGAPLRSLQEVYAATGTNALINRMLALDFKFTLSDNDLPKVTRMCELAGIDVAFPMLEDDVIDFAGGLAPWRKLKGTRLRPFFKEALKDFLPREIIAKEKHGFGLPVGIWLQRHSGLRAMAGDHLLSLRRRNIIRGDFIDRLLDEHLSSHPAYYGTMVWILLMLELWFERHQPAYSSA
jgi:asparagine synthase (glutamine-hydrolysing)